VQPVQLVVMVEQVVIPLSDQNLPLMAAAEAGAVPYQLWLPAAEEAAGPEVLGP
jgi:hypothetical protein